MLTSQPGDANRDGQFDQVDILTALQGGRYLTGRPATWAEGDWNGDGLFDRLDIIAALQTGLYLQGSYAAAAAEPLASSLRVTEINYNPHVPLVQFLEQDVDNDEFEFVELANVGSQPIQLQGVRFAQTPAEAGVEGIGFVFAAQMLAPGERVVIVENTTAFRSRYGNAATIAAGDDGDGGDRGEFAGGLGNGGELLTLVDGSGGIIQQFLYGDSGDWPGRPDGFGSSLEVLDAAGDYGSGENWRSSSEIGGSPGTAGLGPDNRVVFNEVLSHTDPPDADMIELLNTTGSPVSIDNWSITDTAGDFLRYRISQPVPLAAGGYHVISASQFESELGGLSSYLGEELWLIETSPMGKPIRFVDSVDFGATANGVSLGRWPNGPGRLFPMAQRTFGAANTGPLLPDVMISEIQYYAADPDGAGPLTSDAMAYLEVYNRSPSAVDLTNWRVSGGIEFTFEAGTLIGPGETLVVVPFLPSNTSQRELFYQTYGVNASVRLVGPYKGQLSHAGENVQLEWPDEPPAEEPDIIPWILEDRVKYDDDLPWPTTPDGKGDSLARTGAEAFGDFATSWTAHAQPGSGRPLHPPGRRCQRGPPVRSAGPGASGPGWEIRDSAASLLAGRRLEWRRPV